jgi:HSP20 family molecular chaperone IbpA
VEQVAPDRVRITMAVAGFSPDQLEVTVENNQLLVTGKRDADGREDTAYLHRGIAARGFQRSFVLADGMEVEGALLEHGLLHLEVIRPQPEHSVKRISIRRAG